MASTWVFLTVMNGSLCGSLCQGQHAEFLRRLRAAEHCDSTFHITAECRLERRDGSGAPALVGTSRLEIWRESAPLGRMRAKFAPEILPSETGGCVSTWSESAFNGRVGVDFLDRMEQHGRQITLREATVRAARPQQLEWAADACGWAGSTMGAGEGMGRYISDIIGDHPETWRARSDGGASVRFAFGEQRHVEWDFDAECGLLRRIYTRSGTVVDDLQVMGTLTATNAAARYPHKLVQTIRAPGGELLERRFIECISFESVSSEESLYSIDLPSGTTLTDGLLDGVVRIGPDAKELPSAIGAQVSEVRETLSELGRAASPSETLPVSRWIGGIVVVGAIVAFLILWWAKTRRRTGGVLLFLGSAMAVRVNGQAAFEPALAELPAERVYNCGLNAVGFVLSYHGHSWGAEDLAKELECSATWGRPANLAAMADACRRRGLSVSGVQRLAVAELRHAIGDSAILIVHEEKRRGHFTVVVGNGVMVAVIDPSRAVRYYVEGDGQLERWALGLSGYGLIIKTKEGRAQAPLDLAIAVRHEVDGGRLVRRGDACIRLPVVNTAAVPLRLGEAQSSCSSCFKSANFGSGAEYLVAGGRDELCLWINSEKLGVGDNKRNVRLAVIIGGVVRYLEVTWTAVGHDGGRGGEKAIVIPELVDMGVIRSDAARSEGRLALILPSGWHLVRTDGEEGLGAAVRAVGAWQAGERAGTRVELAVSWESGTQGGGHRGGLRRGIVKLVLDCNGVEQILDVPVRWRSTE